MGDNANRKNEATTKLHLEQRQAVSANYRCRPAEKSKSSGLRTRITQAVTAHTDHGAVLP